MATVRRAPGGASRWRGPPATLVLGPLALVVQLVWLHLAQALLHAGALARRAGASARACDAVGAESMCSLFLCKTRKTRIEPFSDMQRCAMIEACHANSTYESL